MKILVLVSTILLFLLLASGTLMAQLTGEIRGRVSDERGEALPGVAISVRSPNLQGLRTAVSDKGGGFRLPLLPVGPYALTFELAGFEKLTMTGNDVRLGLTLALSVVLKPATIGEEVVVVASSPLIETTNADASYRLGRTRLDLATTQARTIAEIVDLAPGVTGVRSDMVTGGVDTDWIPGLTAATGLPGFRGQGSGANNWLVDGLSTRGVAFNDPGVRVNYDAWDEVQIVTDGFAPEWGHGLGGFVNIVTRSGGNALHGALGGLAQPAGLRAGKREQMAAAIVPDSSPLQVFGNLGGPIVKDRLWFFLSNDLFANADRTGDRVIGWLAIPGGERRLTTNNVFGKITWAPSPDHTLSLGGTLDEFLSQTGGIGVPETYTKPSSSRYSYRLNYRGILSQNTLLTAAWGQNRNKTGIQPLSGDFGRPPFYWLDIGQMTDNTPLGNRILQRRTDLSAALVRYLDLGGWGDHEIRAGASYYAYSDDESWHWTGVGFDPFPDNGFDNGTGINWAGPGLPVSIWESAVGEAHNTTRGFGFYAEDQIVLGRLSFMLGLRTETQQVFDDRGMKAWGWGIGDFLQPRATAAWDIAGDGRNVLKFGYGLYSMPVSTSILPFVNSQPLFARRRSDWIGPANPTDAQLKDPANWDFKIVQDWPREVDPGLKPDKTQRLLLAFERQLGSSWALRVRGIYSRARDLINPISVYDPGAPLPFIKRLLTNFELKRRSYRALEVELDGQIPGRLALRASYTWSQAKGTAPGDFFEAVSWDVYFGGSFDASLFGYHPLFPVDSPLKDTIDEQLGGLGGRGIGDEGWYGFLPDSVDHVIKLSGTVFAPLGINVSTDVQYLSGYHWEKKGWSPGITFCATFPEGRGVRTTPPHAYVDVLVTRDLRLRSGLTLEMGINAYNLLNSQRPVSYFKSGFVKADTVNPQFGRVWARQLPRWVQLRLALKF